MPKRLGKNQQKILLILSAGIALGLNRSFSGHFRILKNFKWQWDKINDYCLNSAIKSLYKSNLINLKEKNHGEIIATINDRGKKQILIYKLDKMKLRKTKTWDKKWRVIIFDIPESQRVLRDILRHRLNQLDFYELQKSVYVTPYSCEKEIKFLVEIYNLKKYVRVITAKSIDSEIHILKYFNFIK